ncbi:MAG: glycosyltransferase family 4 protein [Planctomycetota bacterium]
MSTSQLEPVEATGQAARRSTKPLRVALLTNENAPYRVPLYAALGETEGWDFCVFTCIDREHDRQWSVAQDLPFSSKKSFSLRYTRRQRVDGPGPLETRRQVHVPVGVVPDLLRFRPDVAISSEFGARTLMATVTARLAGHRLMVYSESTPHTEASPGARQKDIRRYVGRRLDGCICNGKQSRLFLEELGVPGGSIFEVGQALDVDSFSTDLSSTERSRTRSELGAEGLTFLYVGHLAFTKGLGQLLESWAELCDGVDEPITLLLAGDGPDRGELESMAARLGLQNVRVLGYWPREDLARVYQSADVFAFPTLRDCFSLAFEEAMASGLPVIGSVYGGESELVEEGVNGWVADPLAAGSLTGALREAYAARELLGAMGDCSRRSVERMSIDLVADRIRAAVREVVNRPRLGGPAR